MIRVTLTLDMPEIWGADETFAAGGPEAVKELVLEDTSAYIWEAAWKIEKIEEK